MDSVRKLLHLTKKHHTEGLHGDNAHMHHSEYPAENPTTHEVTQYHPHGGAGATASVPDVRPAAEVGNNFPGTNPHPDHSALGAMRGRGLVFSGRQ